MASDPRQRRHQILLSGPQDAMEEDEEEDEDELFEAPEVGSSMAPTSATMMGAAMGGAHANSMGSGRMGIAIHKELISNFITPSPFPHHTTGPTSSRFRNAITRITTHPTSDVEAWQALMTEVANCYRSIQSKIHTVDAEIQLQLDWIESCYGTLLKYFPYSTAHSLAVGELLFAQSAMVGEDQGPPAILLATAGLDHQRQQQCQAKLEYIFFKTLGIYMDGTKPSLSTSTSSASDPSSTTTTTTTMPLTSDNNNDPATDSAPENDKTNDINNASLKDTSGTTTTTSSSSSADPTALLGGICTASQELWMLYVQTRIRQARRDHPQNEAVIRDWGTKAYELAIEHAGFGFSNNIVWKSYLQYVKTTLAGDPQYMVTLRSVYQRLVCHPMTGLDQLWQEYEQFERQQSEALAQALISEYTPKYQHARTVYLERNRVFNVQDLQTTRLATPPNLDEIYEEHKVLQLWKTRTSYERTNPERLQGPDLHMRVRTAFKEMACVWTRHPEVWHMWSTWEETTGYRGIDRALAVLQLGQTHISDCTLLAHAQAQLVELHTTHPMKCLDVMEAFLERAPNTLGYTLFQQMTRRYKGKEAARAVFAKARRILTTSSEDVTLGTKMAKEEAAASGGGVGGAGTEGDDTGETLMKTEETENGKRRMVTNRLDEKIGVASNGTTASSSALTSAAGVDVAKESGDGTGSVIKAGPITWHLYACHAMIEHRLNHAPDIAARIYELGLRKHGSFLTQPAYVLRYSQLLLELQDTVNLRALLTRALAACGENNKSNGVAALWDMALQFESLVSIGDPTNVAAALAVERKRREALMGPEIEDVATGFQVGVGESVAIGAQKSTVAEQLVRQDGYDMSSAIVNGMSRSVDVLDILGLWGSGSGKSCPLVTPNNNITTSQLVSEEEEIIPGGKSDAAYQKRLNYAKLLVAGATNMTAVNDPAAAVGGVGVGDAGGGSRLLSARERLQQTAGASSAVGGPGAAPNPAVTMAIQNSPEWLRELLLLLPASRLRTPILGKPPPHLTEMALATLRQSKLPSERPQGGTNENGDDHNTISGNKHKLNGNDSSDDEDDTRGSGGYGTQFRARQRARQMSSATGQSNGIKAE